MKNKICVNCKFAQVFKSPSPKDQLGYCEPWFVCKRENVNLVTGENESLICGDERQYRVIELEPFHCGISGKFYQEKDKK